jgi:tetratricopeptide (TPR) repeat protein
MSDLPVIGSVIEDWQVLDLLSALVDKSLVVYEQGENGQGRYHLLETVRQYARDRLMESGGAGQTPRERHRDHFLALAEEAKPKLRGPEQGLWLERLESEHDNLRAALEWCLEDEEGVEAGLRLSGALSVFWQTRGHVSEGRAGSAAALSRLGTQERTKARADALSGAGILAHMQGDYAPARSLFEETLALQREIGDKSGIAVSFMNLGIVASDQGEYDSARSLYEESMALHQELGDKHGMAASLVNLGIVARQQGDTTSARSLYEQGLALQREFGDRRGMANSLNNLGNLARTQGNYALARSFFEESLAVQREIGNKQGMANALMNLGTVAGEQSDHASARSLFEEGLALQQELGDKRGITMSFMNLGSVASDQGDYASARSLFAEGLALQKEIGDKSGIVIALVNLGLLASKERDYAASRSCLAECLRLCLTLGDRLIAAYALEGFAALAKVQERPDKATRLYGAADALRESVGVPLPPSEREEVGGELAVLRATLGENTFNCAWAAGRAMTWEQAIEHALAEDG